MQGILALAIAAAVAGCGSDSETTSTSDSPAVVAPNGAPYSYEVPSGFEEASTTFPGDGPRFLTGVVPSDAPEQSGGLSTFQWTLDAPQRAYSTERLLRWLDEETLAFYRGAGATLAQASAPRSSSSKAAPGNPIPRT